MTETTVDESSSATDNETLAPCTNMDVPSICELHERARIVAWLRKIAAENFEPVNWVADGIERGEHEH